MITKIVGVTFPNRNGSDRQEIIRRCRIGESISLIREPENEYDSNAVKVCRCNGDQLGYIKRDWAVKLAGMLDSGWQYTGKILDIQSAGGKSVVGVTIQFNEIPQS